MMTRRIATTLALAALTMGAAACGTSNVNDLPDNETADIENGAHLFYERCSGCHTLDAVGARGSKPESDVASGERTNGPNFNTRRESYDDILFAIRNGGFSGAIMPANIVVGKDAEQVARFLEKYAGRKAPQGEGTDVPSQGSSPSPPGQ